MAARCLQQLPEAPPHLILQRPYARVLLVELLLLESDPLQQIVDASVLVLQHHLSTGGSGFSEQTSFLFAVVLHARPRVKR